jgi:hypothetical protein
MKTLKLTFALLVLTLMSCSTDDSSTDGEQQQTQEPIIGTWNPVRYEIYDPFENEPSEIGEIPCGIVFTIDAKEEPDYVRVRRTDCSGNTANNFRYTWIKTDTNTYTYETNTYRVVEVDGDIMTDNSGGEAIGSSYIVTYYDRVAPINTDN